jgi:hypothetical protein
MGHILSCLTIIDWILLGLVASATLIIAIGVHAIRKEMRAGVHSLSSSRRPRSNGGNGGQRGNPET